MDDPIALTATLTATMTCKKCHRQSSYTVQEFMTEEQLEEESASAFDSDGWDFRTSLCWECSVEPS